MKKPASFGFAFVMAGLLSLGLYSISLAKKKVKNPQMVETEQGRILQLPPKLEDHLDIEFPGHKIPKESDFDAKMLRYYHSRLIGVHPAITWGDFNGDKKRDYAMLLITGESPWGPLIELVVFNGRKKGKFETFRVKEVYNYKDNYVSLRNGKLYKGKFKQGGWYINWDKKGKDYKIFKS